MPPTDLSDDDLIARFARGQADAFDRLVRRWERRVFELAYRFMGNAEEAEDVGQQVFLKLYRRLTAFDGRSGFATWLYRVVVNQCRDRQRAAKVRRPPGSRVETAAMAAGPQVPGWERSELSQTVERAVASLPAAEREVVILRHYHDLTFAEIAEILEVPATTLKSRLAVALKRLRTELDKV
jgi:RNA polymerase sigma-70 factor (ECF subfamily)